MNTVVLSWRYLWARPLAAGLNLLLMTLGLGSITFVLLASHQLDRAFERDLAGIDVVVGAKGSPMQLILAGVFHIDVPPGNIPLADVQALAKHPQVAQLIPLSLGDSFRGFRIVGTTPAYITHYQATLAQGAIWAAPMQAVVGAQVAAATGLKAGDRFEGSHGLGGGGDAHGHTPYTVAGVLAPCGCVLDRLILTATESVWTVHEDMHRGDTPLAAVTFPRYVNSSTDMQSAAPAVEITRLLGMVGVGTRVLQGFGAVLLLTAALGVFIALWSAVRERRSDLAMLRMLGAPPWKVGALLLCEALWLALLASALGLLAGHGLTAVAGWFLQADKSVVVDGWQWVPQEVWVPVAALGVALLAALLPAVSAYRVDVARLLNAR